MFFSNQLNVIQCITALILITVLAPSAFAIPYDGNGPGESTIGANGDYPSLAAASKSIKTAPLNGGDWTFLILNDLSEPANSSICQSQLNGNTITIRPAPSTSCTVTFTTTNTLNIFSLSGHITIGEERYRSSTTSTLVHLVPTSNIIIDGSNQPNGNSKNLTLKNVAGAGAVTLITVRDNCDNIIIKNITMESHGAADTDSLHVHLPTAGVDLREGRFYVESTHVSDNCQIINSVIDYRGYRPVAGISLNTSMAANGFSTGITIQGNTVIGTAMGLQLQMAVDVNVSANVIRLNTSTTDTLPYSGIQLAGVRFPTVTSNTVEFAHPAEPVNSYEGIACSGFDCAFIANNIITGLESSFSFYSNRTRYGIRNGGRTGTTMTVVHNSIEMRQTIGDTSASYVNVAGIFNGHGTGGIGTLLIHNNIVRNSASGGAAIATEGSTASLVSNNNNLYAPNGFIGASSFRNYQNLSAWQAATGLDTESISHDPYVPAAAGFGTWAAPAGMENSTLRFTSCPGPSYLVPSRDDVRYDIDGDNRNSSAAIMGADEIPHAPASVKFWQLY